MRFPSQPQLVQINGARTQPSLTSMRNRSMFFVNRGKALKTVAIVSRSCTRQQYVHSKATVSADDGKHAYEAANFDVAA